MSTPFQNRLVGTIIVAAAAVIFLPDLLDGQKQTSDVQFEGIPQAPIVAEKPITSDFPEKTLANIPTTSIDKAAKLNQVFENNPYNQQKKEKVAKQKEVVAEQIVNSTPKSPVVENQPKAPSEQWVVQLGSFRHEKNVKQLVTKLKEHDFKVFTQPIKTKHGSLTKVFVGPVSVKASLENQLAKLKTVTKIDGKVSRYKSSK